MASPQNFVSISRRPPDVEDYVDMFRRYRSWIIGPTFGGLVLAVVVAFLWPDTYLSKATMQITPPQVPERLVSSLTTQTLTDRLQAMQTAILSSGSLSEIILSPALDLFKKERQKLPLEDVVTEMRNKHIVIAPYTTIPGATPDKFNKYTNAFTIQFSYTDRYKAQAVVRLLLNKFIEQNVQVGKNQTNMTSSIIREELKQAKDRLDNINTSLTKFRLENPGKLPEQETANISAMTMSQLRLQNISQAIGREEQDKMLLETDLQTLKDRQAYSQSNMETTVAGTAPVAVRNEQLVNLERDISTASGHLAQLKELYGVNHPDVSANQAIIDSLEKRKLELLQKDVAAVQTPLGGTPAKVVVDSRMAAEVENLKAEQKKKQALITTKQMEIEELTRQKGDIEKQVDVYRKRMEDAPLNLQQYASMMGEYSLAKQQYEDMTRKSEQSDTAQSLQEHQAGETLITLDQATLPEVATDPVRPVWAAVGACAGLALGLLLAAGKEVKDTSLKNLKDVRAYTNMPVLSSIPLLENALLVRRKRRLVWLAWSTAVIIGCILMSGSIYYHITSV